MVDVYRIHFEHKFVLRKRALDENYTETVSISLRVLLFTGYHMSHSSVLRNLRLNFKCERCKLKIDDVYDDEDEDAKEERMARIRACDGRYPVLYGANFPEGADGRHFPCFRGLLCGDCDDAITGEGTKYWFCEACSSPPETVDDALGTGIVPPLFLSPDGMLSSSSWPQGGDFGLPGEHPADRWLRLVQKRAETQARVLATRGDVDVARRLINSSSSFLRCCRNKGMNRGQMGSFLEVIHDIHDRRELLKDGDEHPPELALPKDIRTAEDRADGSVHQDYDVEVQERHFDQSTLGQLCKVVSVYVTDPKLALQALLLDAPPGSVFLQKRGGLIPKLVESSGIPVRGYEIFFGTRWADLLQTIRMGVYLLGFSIHSDVINKGLHNFYPVSISCVNVPHEYRTKRNGNVKFAMSKNPIIRLARNTLLAENLSEEDKVEKYNLQSRIFAEILAFLDRGADQVQEFLVRDANGELQRYEFMLRMVSFEADLEEIKHVFGLKGHICATCIGLVLALKEGNPGSQFLPCLRREPQYSCATAKRRTPLQYVRMQAEITILRRLGKVHESTEKAREYHIRPFVRNSLLALINILPHEAGGPFPTTGLDRLHGINKGSARTYSLTADYFMRKKLLATRTYKTGQDVRAFQDKCLSQFGHHYNNVNFNEGFWGSPETGGSLKGDEQLALCRLLPFTFLGSDSRMQNTDNFRETFLRHYYNFLKLVAEFGTPQFYTEEEMDSLGRDIHECVDGFEWCMQRAKGFVGEDEKSELKNGFDTLKGHVFGGAAEAIRRLGSLLCNDTEIGERNMLDISLHYLNVAGNDKAIIVRVNSVRMDAAITNFETFYMPKNDTATRHLTEEPSAPVYRATRARIGSGVPWALFTDVLLLGENGPCVNEKTTEEMFLFLRTAFGGISVTFIVRLQRTHLRVLSLTWYLKQEQWFDSVVDSTDKS